MNVIIIILKIYRERSPYGYKGNESSIDEDIKIYERTKNEFLLNLNDNPKEINDRFDEILRIQESLLALKFIKKDITYIKKKDITSPVTDLGEGSFGVVKLYNIHGSQCAVKQLDGGKNARNKVKVFEALNSYYDESHAARKTTHPNVVRILGFSVNPFRIITEYASNGDLSKFIGDEAKYSSLDTRKKFSIAFGIANGLEWIVEVSGIVHRDLKPDNILLDKSFTPKISDFGIVDFLKGDSDDSRLMPKGNPLHRPPESLKRKNPYTDKTSCVYAYGLILYSIMTGKKPYSELEHEPARKFVRTVCVEKRLPDLDGLSEDIKSIISQCLSHNPEERPTFTKIKKMLWDVYMSKAITHDDPRKFWSDNFFGEFEVSFDGLIKGFDRMSITEKVTKVFCGGDGQVITPSKFDYLYSTFGPWYDPSKRYVFEEAVNLINEEWFVSDSEKDDAAIKGCPDKTFYVRMSTKAPFCIVFMYKKEFNKLYIKRTSTAPSVYKCFQFKDENTVNDIVKRFKERGFIQYSYKPSELGYGFNYLEK